MTKDLCHGRTCFLSKSDKNEFAIILTTKEKSNILLFHVIYIFNNSFSEKIIEDIEFAYVIKC